MSAMKQRVSGDQNVSVSGTDLGHVRTVETAAATIRFAGGCVSDSSDSDCGDDTSSTNREFATRSATQPVDRLINNNSCIEDYVSVTRVNDDPSSNRRQQVEQIGSRSCLKDDGTNHRHEEMPQRTSPHPHSCLSSDSRTMKEPVRTGQGNIGSPEDTSPVDRVNRLSLRFNPFNTLCQEDDTTEGDFSHRHNTSRSEGTSPGGHRRPQVVRTDSMAGACQPVPTGETADEPIMVTTGGKFMFSHCTSLLP